MRGTYTRIPTMILTVLLVSVHIPSALATTHTVTQINLTFNPASLTIVAGDTVRWVHTGGSHTVTSGTGAADPSAGTLFDQALNATSPTVEYVFNSVGVFPYFCRPHEGLGMKATVTVETPTGIGSPGAPTFVLRQNHPNPFTAKTTIEYTLDEPAEIALAIYDVRGRLVASLHRGRGSAGSNLTTWDGRDGAGKPVRAGVYFYRLETRGTALTRKLLLIR